MEGGVTNVPQPCQDIAPEPRMETSITFPYKAPHFLAAGILCWPLDFVPKKIPFHQLWFELGGKGDTSYLH